MSLFLGPIHHLMYRRIQNLEDLANQSLATIIDESNIHGWLQAPVDRVEIKLNAAVSAILTGDPQRTQSMIELWAPTVVMNCTNPASLR